MISVSELAIYPLKSCRQHTVNRWAVDNFGLAGDRRWMLVEQGSGRFITQRTHPVMVLIECRLIEGGLVLSATGRGMIEVFEPVDNANDDTNVQVSIWKDQCSAIDAGDSAAQWCSALIETECRLVYMPDSSFRQVDLKYANTGVRNGFPFLLISEASLGELNDRLESPVPMLRFRPNIVVTGCEAYAEDSWKHIRIGDVEFTVAKACTRCVMTTINPDTVNSGALEKNKEPLKTLASYRRTESGVIFGQNLVHHSCGVLEVGMSVEVLD